MKICPKCGAIWEDNRSTCLDCDTVLPNALSTEEAEEVREDVSDSLYDMAENADDFAVSPREKVFGILSFVGCVAVLVLFVLASTKYNTTASPIVRSVMELAMLIGLVTPLFFAVSGCLFLFPRLMWNLFLYTREGEWASTLSPAHVEFVHAPVSMVLQLGHDPLGLCDSGKQNSSLYPLHRQYDRAAVWGFVVYIKRTA